MSVSAMMNNSMVNGMEQVHRYNKSIGHTGESYDTHRLLRLVLPPILIVIATVGNVIGFLVVDHSSRLSQMSVSVYIRLYFIVSTLVLFLGTGQNWVCLLTDSSFLWDITDYACRIWEFLSAVLFYFPVWLLVAFVTDRWLEASHSRHATFFCTVFSSKVVSLGILCGLVITSVHAMWTFELLPHRGCGIPADRLDFHTLVWPWISVVIYSLLPLGWLLTCAICLIVKDSACVTYLICRLSRRRQVPGSLDVKDISSQTEASNETTDLIFNRGTSMLDENVIKKRSDAANTRSFMETYDKMRLKDSVNLNDRVSESTVESCICDCSAPEGRKFALCGDKLLLRDTEVSSPCCGCSSRVLVPTAICSALICFICTVPATVLNVYMTQVWRNLSSEKESLDRLKFLFTMFQMLPVVNHAIMPFVGFVTSRLIREECSAYFRRSTDSNLPHLSQSDSLSAEVVITAV